MWLACFPVRRVYGFLSLPRRIVERFREEFMEKAREIREAIRSGRVRREDVLRDVHEIHRGVCVEVARSIEPGLDIERCAEGLDRLLLGEIDWGVLEKEYRVRAEWLAEIWYRARRRKKTAGG